MTIKKSKKKYNFVYDQHLGLSTEKYADLPERYVVFYGRIGEEKGIRLLMKIWNELEEIPLVVMGSGPLEDEFSEWSKKHGNVYFLGYTDHKKCLSIVKKSEFVIFPSIWYEGCSMVEIESESLGKPLIATDIGFSSEAIKNGVNGFKVPLENIEEFVRSICELWNDPEKCREMGINARKDFEEKYRAENNYTQLMSIYQSLFKCESNEEIRNA